ncbi:hypothetical protein [Limnobacter sp.]|uniref:hypothetical protein n=1 Tax=Limnobacter sp. TaxID=2003368 RepID=UPI002FDF66EB
MLSVYGVARSELISQGNVLAEFPPFLGRPVGGTIPVDCKVGVVGLAVAAASSASMWAWKPADQGYVLVMEEGPFSLLKNHLRRMRHMQDDLGRNRVWPWFDPRYLKLALGTLQGQDLVGLFGPVKSFCFSAHEGLDIYQLQSGKLHIKQVSSC